ncbi:MAG: hypothetical protein PHF49_03410 [Patescibacteria group bacterium]|nr:hypothetical protein [Patescibacteria group bacterium]MDD4444098.1 hypothetical protein [Patescibacteria group bacterium]
MNILLDDKKIDFSLNDLPILISGAEKTGSSLFTICLLTNLVKSGHKVILFSAHLAAKEEFRNQVGSGADKALIIESESEDVFIEIIKTIPDLSERVVLIKNIDSYTQKLFNVVKDLKFVIFSGDLDKCQFADDLMNLNFESKIFFSFSEKCPVEELKELPKYFGKIIGEKYNGVIKLDI